MSFLESLLSLPGLYAPAISPDGRWIAWSWFRLGPGADVFVAPTDGSAAPMRLTDTHDDTIVSSWAPDSASLLVEQDKDGNERVRIFRIRPDRPMAMEPLTEDDPPYFLRGGMIDPANRFLIYGANFDFERGEEIEPTWVYRHDLASGERVPLARPERGHWYAPELSPQGTHVLYSRADLDPAGEQVWLVDVEGREDREILTFGDNVKVHATWCADGRRVVFLAEHETYRRLGLWDGGDIRWLIDDPARNLENVHAPLRTRWVCVEEEIEARARPSFVDPDTGREILLSPGFQPVGPLPDGREHADGLPDTWIWLRYASTQPSDLVRKSIPLDAGTSLSRVWDRTALTPADFVPAEDFRWASVDGLPIQGWLYRTKGEARGTVVYVHGGPTAHSEDAINVTIQYLASRGFNVLDPNYRGSTGFGLTFQDAIKEDGWGGREQDDIRAGIESLIAAGVARPGRVGMTGTSYGGYTSWWAITHWPTDVLAAAAPICGMTDLVVDYETTRPDLRPYSEEMMGGSPDQVPDKYRERSPIHYVDRIRGALLVVQGLQDPNVTTDNVREVREALDRAGVRYEVLAFEDEGHGISRPANLKVLCERLESFFAQAFASAS